MTVYKPMTIFAGLFLFLSLSTSTIAGGGAHLQLERPSAARGDLRAKQIEQIYHQAQRGKGTLVETLAESAVLRSPDLQRAEHLMKVFDKGKDGSPQANPVHWTATVERTKMRNLWWAYQACGQDDTHVKRACQARQLQADSSAGRQTQEGGLSRMLPMQQQRAQAAESPDSSFSHQPH
jgi:hypothetical protein